MSGTYRTTSAEDLSGWQTVGWLLAGLLLLYYVVPVAGLVFVRSPGQILTGASAPGVRSAILHSLVSATASTALAVAFGVPLAYWLARTESRMRTLVTTLVLLPLVLPPVVSGMLLLTVLGPDALGSIAGAHGISLTRSLLGVILAQTFVASPLLVVTVSAAFRRIDPQLEEAARTLGHGREATARRVTVPLARGGIVAGIALTFARAIGEFGATMMVAYYPRTLPVQIWATFYAEGLDEAFVLAVVLLAVSLVSLAVITRVGTTPWR